MTILKKRLAVLAMGPAVTVGGAVRSGFSVLLSLAAGPQIAPEKN
jgi:hypothetical protein